MITGWQTSEERLRKAMKIPPAKKLELLEELHRLAVKTSSKRLMAIRWKLRENRRSTNKLT